MRTHTHTHVYKRIHIHIHTHMHIYTYIHVRTHTHIHIYTHTHTKCTYARTQARLERQRASEHARSWCRRRKPCTSLSFDAIILFQSGGLQIYLPLFVAYWQYYPLIFNYHTKTFITHHHWTKSPTWQLKPNHPLESTYRKITHTNNWIWVILSSFQEVGDFWPAAKSGCNSTDLLIKITHSINHWYLIHSISKKSTVQNCQSCLSTWLFTAYRPP